MASEHRKSCLEDSTERSESNPGRSLGIIHISGDGCLEDSTMTSISIRVNPLNPCSCHHCEFFSNTDLSDSTDASLGGRYCLPDSHSLHVYNPETTSRVTLAALGIGFQPNHVGCLVVYTINKITKQQNKTLSTPCGKHSGEI